LRGGVTSAARIELRVSDAPTALGNKHKHKLKLKLKNGRTPLTTSSSSCLWQRSWAWLS
jgi:hypothetical protein